ncbi:MAG TPA: phosphoribosyltransferase [Gemmatimonadaceae bacterium]|nr:phosphoribosyltransferase [Gemmatimonadaceae bacterium]
MIGFRHRRDAGRRLAAELQQFAGRKNLLVLALPRGGVPVGYEVARALGAPLDVLIVRKLGVPGHEELAMGAIASGGLRVLDERTIRMAGVPGAEIERTTAAEMRELARREAAYRGTRPFPDLTGRTVIVVDDGLATGATMRAAVGALRQRQPAAIIVAVPVAASATCEALRWTADDCVCVAQPEPFYGVGLWYHDFSQTTDDEVRALLDAARTSLAPTTEQQRESEMHHW